MGPRNNSALTFISEAFHYTLISLKATTALSTLACPSTAEDFKYKKSKKLKRTNKVKPSKLYFFTWEFTKEFLTPIH